MTIDEAIQLRLERYNTVWKETIGISFEDHPAYAIEKACIDQAKSLALFFSNVDNFNTITSDCQNIHDFRKELEKIGYYDWNTTYIKNEFFFITAVFFCMVMLDDPKLLPYCRGVLCGICSDVGVIDNNLF